MSSRQRLAVWIALLMPWGALLRHGASLEARGADPNRPDRAGQSPLMLVRQENFDQLVALMEKR